MLLHKLWHSYISISYNFIISVVGCKEFKLLGITIDNIYFYSHVFDVQNDNGNTKSLNKNKKLPEARSNRHFVQ